MKLTAEIFDKERALIIVTGNKLQLERFFKSTSYTVSNSPTEVRSLLQNNAFHGDCTVISTYTGYTPDQVKVMIKEQFAEYFPVKKIINPLTGTAHYEQKGTKDLSKKRFAEFQSEYRAWFEMKLDEPINWYDKFTLYAKSVDD